jgi:hypothetical protein
MQGDQAITGGQIDTGLPFNGGYPVFHTRQLIDTHGIDLFLVGVPPDSREKNRNRIRLNSQIDCLAGYIAGAISGVVLSVGADVERLHLN